jgi:hypothetical protein
MWLAVRGLRAEGRLGPWIKSTLQTQSRGAGTTDNATEPGQLNTMRHLVAYIKGAANIA